MRLELTLAGFLIKLANHYTTGGALDYIILCSQNIFNDFIILTIFYDTTYLKFLHKRRAR